MLENCFFHDDYETARLLVSQTPYEWDSLSRAREEALAQLAAEFVRLGDQKSWRPLYRELVQSGFAKHYLIIDVIARHGWLREAVTLARVSSRRVYSALIEAGEYDLLFEYRMLSPSYRERIAFLATATAHLEGREAAKGYLRQLDNSVSRVAWLLGVAEFDTPPLTRRFPSISRSQAD